MEVLLNARDDDSQLVHHVLWAGVKIAVSREVAASIRGTCIQCAFVVRCTDGSGGVRVFVRVFVSLCVPPFARSLVSVFLFFSSCCSSCLTFRSFNMDDVSVPG